jgi:cytochrome c556
MRITTFFLIAGVTVVVGTTVAQTNKAKPVGNLKQVMRSIPYPNSNILFEVQSKAPKDDAEWKAVENAAIAIAETANLITLPGRLREDGKPVPVQNADWNKFAQGLVSAGQACYKAAVSKNQDAVSTCTGDLSDSCSNCHEVYRDK